MIDIIIVNWNTENLIRECINSINQNSDGLISQIIVVDNDSSDSSDVAIEGMSKVKLIKLQENLGFAKACNIGSGYSKSKYLLFLNPDTLIYPGVFARVFAFMEHNDNSRVGICGVQQINRDGDVSRHSATLPTLYNFIYLTLGLNHIFPKLGHVMKYWHHKDSRQVDHVIGSFYFIRRKIFDKVQGFDERFFMYLEDLDLSCRVKKMGWQIMYLSDVNIKHYAGGSSQKLKARRLFYSLRSRLLYVEKHFGKKEFFIIFILIFSLELLIRLLQSLFRFSFASFKETWIGFWHLAIWIINNKIGF